MSSARAALASAAAGAPAQQRKRKVRQDPAASNRAGFAQPAAASTAALERWRAARPASAEPVGVLAMQDGDEYESKEERQERIDARVVAEHAALALPNGARARPDTFTANGDASFSSSRCARLDLFYNFVRGAESDKVSRLCTASWSESAEQTVQLLMHSRDARSGKGERLISYFGMIWLRDLKPATYLLNLTTFLQLGCFKDLLQLAAMVKVNKLAPLGAHPREDKVRQSALNAQREKRRRKQPAPADPSFDADAPPEHECLELEVMAEYLRSDWEKLKKHQARVAARKAKVAALEEEIQEERKEKAKLAAASAPAAASASAVEPSMSDVEDEEDDLDWAEALEQEEAEKADREACRVADAAKAAGDWAPPARRAPRRPRVPREPHCQLSLAAKWAPTEGSAFDKKHGFAKRLARLLFPDNPQCFRLYRELLSQCRAHLAVPERFLCARQYERIDFEKIPSRCHQLLRAALTKRCGERYTEYKAALSRGEKKINTAGLMPHDLATPYITGGQKVLDEAIEGAWRTLLNNLRSHCVEEGGLASAVAVVDVSGSMGCFNGLPMNVAISLGLLIAELAAPPFRGRAITFSSTPEWHVIPPLAESSLYTQVNSLQRAHWGMSTDLERVFTLILKTAVQARCRQEDMPKTVFIFSDMQFNAAVGEGSRHGVHSSTRRLFHDAGYTLPNIVYWNLNGLTHSDCPVDVSTPGVALIGGYSAELLKAFLAGQNIDPLGIMMHSIDPYTAIIEESER